MEYFAKVDYDKPHEVTQLVLNGMIEIGGMPTNQEFYNEFNSRLKLALNLINQNK